MFSNLWKRIWARDLAGERAEAGDALAGAFPFTKAVIAQGITFGEEGNNKLIMGDFLGRYQPGTFALGVSQYSGAIKYDESGAVRPWKSGTDGGEIVNKVRGNVRPRHKNIVEEVRGKERPMVMHRDEMDEVRSQEELMMRDPEREEGRHKIRGAVRPRRVDLEEEEKEEIIKDDLGGVEMPQMLVKDGLKENDIFGKAGNVDTLAGPDCLEEKIYVRIDVLSSDIRRMIDDMGNFLGRRQLGIKPSLVSGDSKYTVCPPLVTENKHNLYTG